MDLFFPETINWLFLDLNSYFASVEQQRRPELRGRPVAVVPLQADSTCAIAASYEAKAYGVKTGTKIYDAKRMCSHLICITANHAHYTEYHHRILAEIDRHIPVTSIESIDEVACRLDRSERTPEAAIALAHRIKAGIRSHVGEAIRCSIGIAPNRFLAKVATELEKPDGLVVITPADIPQKLLGLHFDDIPGLGKAMQHRLYKAGISSMEQLYSLPPKQMRAIWHNVGGERMWYKLRGVELEQHASERRTVSHSHVLSPDQRPEAQARLVSQRLLMKAVSRMRRLGYGATALQQSVRLVSGEQLASDVRFPPLSDHASIQQHWQRGWESLLANAPSPAPRLRKVSLNLHGLVAMEAIQPDLFDAAEEGHAETSERKEQLSAVMDTLNQRYGRGTVTLASGLGRTEQVTGTRIAFSRIPEQEEFKE